jgi:RimJ/RimL family protein N-acetyltransferase
MNVHPFSGLDQDIMGLTAVLNTVCAEGMMRTPRFEPTPAWEHALARPDCPCHLLLVATDGANIVGWCRLFPTDANGEAELGIGLLAPTRGHGLGTQMLLEAIAWAHERRLARLVLTTRADNHQALRLFTKHGFVPTGRKEEDWIEMALGLQLLEARSRP